MNFYLQCFCGFTDQQPAASGQFLSWTLEAESKSKPIFIDSHAILLNLQHGAVFAAGTLLQCIHTSN